ncbi:MAG: HAD-IC family P-type ATPase [Clostridia bacterium]|nr:HAD-IC family P-type ATPase [Clostridia bacterium]
MYGSLEAKSTHPIAKAFIEYMKNNNIDEFEVENFENITGYGITGTINNEKIILGNAKILSYFKIENKYEKEEKVLSENGNSIVYVVKDKEILAIIGVNDIIREDMKGIIRKLKENNKNIIMLTGDNENVAKNIAQELDIVNIISNVLPSDKADIIKKLKDEGKNIIMCGDRNK